MNNLPHSTLVAAAIGATIGVISAASIFLYQKVLENRQHANTNTNFEAVNQKINELQAELEALRIQQNQQKKKKRSLRRRNITSSENTFTGDETDFDAFSTGGTDIGDDEFYDCSDSEGADGDHETRTSESVNSLDLTLAAIDQQVEAEEELAEDMYYKLQRLAEAHPSNVEVIWRFARACYSYSNSLSDSNKKKEIMLQGLKICETVLGVRNADLYKWYAILQGSYGEFLPIAEKIKNGYKFKENVLNALEIRPEDSGLHHLLGRFKYEVSSLSWIERKVASTLFSEPPSASYEDAITSFEEAEKYAKKPHLENRLFLSKAYIALNQIPKALPWLDKICESFPSNPEDLRVHKEATELLHKYCSYRL